MIFGKNYMGFSKHNQKWGLPVRIRVISLRRLIPVFFIDFHLT
jgi:hypothetical protein